MKREAIIALGYTLEYIAHIEQQIPGLIEESIKRIKFMPFDTETAFISYKQGGKAYSILQHLCSEAGLTLHSSTLIDDIPSLWMSHFRTEINGMRRDKDHTRLINIRGSLKTIDHMPLYLEEGAYGRQYVYPIFDWSELQTMVAAMMIAEKKPNYFDKGIEKAVDTMRAEEDKLWLEHARKITGE